MEETATSSGANKNNKTSLPLPPLIAYSQVKAFDATQKRIPTGMEEFDRVLGGGIVFGSVNLIGGEPGIGKSTLLTQLVINRLMNCNNNNDNDRKEIGYKVDVSSKSDNETHAENGKQNNQQRPILYVAGEESPEQIALRIERMIRSEKAIPNESQAEQKHPIQRKKEQNSFHKEVQFSSNQANSMQWKKSLFFSQNTDVDDICRLIEQEKPSLVIVDSIQSMSTADLVGTSGSVGQLKESTQRLTTIAKKFQIPIFLIGHVTKEGAIAGPKVLEHIVDAVLELSGERTGSFRLLRAIKNRFGATDEVGVFEIVENGLAQVNNPSELFLQERQKNTPGSVICTVMEGTRPIMVEIQALVVQSQLAMPRRVTRGVSLSRIQLLAAVLQKHCHLPLGTMDIFVNVAGGLSVDEPGVDLAIAVAIASSCTNIPVPNTRVYIGEVGLLGEIRRVSLLEKRVTEAKRLGFSSVITSKDCASIREAIASFSKKG